MNADGTDIFEIMSKAETMSYLADYVHLFLYPRLSGETNDNGRLNRAISFLTGRGGGILYVINENLQIDTSNFGVSIPSNITIKNINTTYNAIANNLDWYSIFWMTNNVQNIEVDGGTFLGDRSTHTGTTGEQGFAICVNGAKNVRLKNIQANNFWGDGIYIGDTNSFQGDNEVYLENISCDNNRRQGISITNGTVKSSGKILLTNSNGTAPQAGLDIEPANSNCQINVKLDYLETKNNTGDGLLIFPSTFAGSTKEFVVEINHHKDTGSNIGFEISHPYDVNYMGKIDGSIKIGTTDYRSNKMQGILITDWLDSDALILIGKAIVKGANSSAYSSYIGAIQVQRSSTSLTGVLGRVRINNTEVDSPSCNYALWLYDLVNTQANRSFKDVILDNLKILSYKDAPVRGDNCWVKPINTIIPLTMANGTTVFSSDSYTYTDVYFNNTANNTITLPNINEGEITIHNLSSFNLSVWPKSGGLIKPYCSAAGQPITLNGFGSITLKVEKGNNFYEIVNIIGSYTAS